MLPIRSQADISYSGKKVKCTTTINFIPYFGQPMQRVVNRISVSAAILFRENVYAPGENEIMEWNYDRANENNTTVRIPCEVNAPS